MSVRKMDDDELVRAAKFAQDTAQPCISCGGQEHVLGDKVFIIGDGGYGIMSFLAYGLECIVMHCKKCGLIAFYAAKIVLKEEDEDNEG